MSNLFLKNDSPNSDQIKSFGTIKKERLPRIGFEVTPEQHKELKRLIPWGLVTNLYQIITEDLIELMKTHGSGGILSVLLNRQVKFYEVSKTLNNDDSLRTETKLSQP